MVRVRGIKILGTGELSKKLKVTASAFSASAKTKIEAKGGTVEIFSAQAALNRPKPDCAI